MHDDDKDDDDGIKIELEARMYESTERLYRLPSQSPANRPSPAPSAEDDAPEPDVDDRSDA